MASIPRDLITQINLSTPRAGAKSLNEAEPFSFLFQTPPAPPPRPAEPSQRPENKPAHSDNELDQSQPASAEPTETAAADAAENAPPQDDAPTELVDADVPPADDSAPPDVKEETDQPEDQPQPETDVVEEAAGVAAAVAGVLNQTAQLETKEVPVEESATITIDQRTTKKEPTRPISIKTPAVHPQDTAQAGKHAPVETGKKTAAEQQTAVRIAAGTKKASDDGAAKSKKNTKTEGRETTQPTATPVRVVPDSEAAASAKAVNGNVARKGSATEGVERVPARGSRRANTSPVTQAHTAESKSTLPSGEVVPNAPSAIETSSGTERAAPEAPVTSSVPTAALSTTPTTQRVNEHLVQRTARKSGNTPNLTQSEQNRFLQRVAKAFDAAKNREGGIRIRLSPPELGSLRLEVRMQQGGMIARLEAETPATRALLIDNLPALRDRLEEQGIRVEQFDVDLLDRRDQPQDQLGQHGQAPDQSATHRRNEPKPERVVDNTHHRDERQEPVALDDSRGINVII